MTKYFVCFIFLTACFTGCKKKCEKSAIYDFNVEMFITPNSKKIKLGDTLLLEIKIKYENIDLETNLPVNVQSSSISTSSLDFVMYRRLADSTVQISGIENFDIMTLKGSFKVYNNASVRITYFKETDNFIFSAFVVPKQKGLVNIANYKAEGWMDGGKCILNIFHPIIGSSNSNHDLFRNFYGPGANGFISENNYYVWVD
ncbi:MAG: hypothetical protein K2X48_07215 [Chitinophagaceae bacterium]|nr:hypothetical protein [Chitinophagaceae bacterium]